MAGNLGTAESVNVDKITSKKEIYSKVRSLVYNDKVVYIELCYINLYDKSGNKVQQEGEASFQVKMSDTMTNAGVIHMICIIMTPVTTKLQPLIQK